MKFLRNLLFLSFIICSLACSKKQERPRYLSFRFEKDSTKVISNNKLLSPAFLKWKKNTSASYQTVNFKAKESKEILSFSNSEMDTISLFEHYTFDGLWFGVPHAQPYDTLYNYGLPFQKNKRYKILQGQNTNFTHKGAFSRYAIDFKMNIGQTICSMRDGVVVKVLDHFKKGGPSKKYRPKANLIMIYHKDGTFAQYAHLKFKGSLVKLGETVKKGQAIGYSGNTGMSTEPHLHFAIYKSSKKGLVSIPYILDSIPTKKYKKGKYAVNN